jgi:tRNA(Ile)-lysidine synthase
MRWSCKSCLVRDPSSSCRSVKTGFDSKASVWYSPRFANGIALSCTKALHMPLLKPLPMLKPPLSLDPSLCGVGQRIAVAFSGGVDSTALLLAAQQTWRAPPQEAALEHSQTLTPTAVLALHVNHGLQLAAAQFEQHCLSVCTRLQLPCVVSRVDASAKPGDSPEDAARRSRYLALAAAAQAQGIGTVLLAQHADDQLESVLLALSRGAGLPGLAGMATHFTRHGTRFVRPWLQVPRSHIEAWLATTGQRFVTDPSNADMRYTRNHIRAELMPALLRVFPQAHRTLARSAAHAAQAQSVLDEVAEQDLASVCLPTSSAPSASPGLPPNIKALQGLSPARQANALRHWLKRDHHTQASATQLAELQKQVRACQTRGQNIWIKVGAGFAQRLGDALHWESNEA